MVAFLSKSDASAGFDQIVDFLMPKDVIRQVLHFDDVDGVECLPNEEIFTELARMGYEMPPPKLMFYKAFFFAQWKFLIHTLVQCISAKRTAWNEFSCSTASAVICLPTADLGVELQGRKDDDNAAIKEDSVAESTVFDDEEVTMTMAQTLIKMKSEKARLLDEQMAKWLHDEEQMQENHLTNIKKYQSLKRKQISIAQARKNMIVYLKNMAGYKMEHFKGMTYDKVRPIFERGYNKVQTLFKPDKDEEPTKKRVVEETLLQESFKKLKAVKVSGSHSTQDTLTDDPKEMSEEDIKNMLEIIPVYEFKVEALHVKYPLIDWEIHSEGLRSYWKIIRVGGITQAYHSFKDMLKDFDKEYLDDHGACSFWGGVVEVVESVGNVEEWQESESVLLLTRKITQSSKPFKFRQHCIKLHDRRLIQFQHSRSHMNVLRSDRNDATKLTYSVQDWECSISDTSYSKNKLTRIKLFPFNNLTIDDASWNSYLKFMLFFGILTFQDAQNALAGSDVGSLMQSSSFFGDLGDISTGFASAFLLIFFSELGDKTFFIAALLAARNSAAIVFTGTFGALGIMTVISVVLGRTFHYVDEILPFRFGDTDLPIDDIAAALLLVYFGVSTLLDASSGDGLKAEEEQKEAEIAVSEVLGNGAGILAAASTILAVLGGSLLGTFLSEKVIAYVGGVLFLVFAAVTVVEIVT
nr:GDT1-like protein 1, chloroplastic [Tanacetum cinerariifolium]